MSTSNNINNNSNNINNNYTNNSCTNNNYNNNNSSCSLSCRSVGCRFLPHRMEQEEGRPSALALAPKYRSCLRCDRIWACTDSCSCARRTSCPSTSPSTNRGMGRGPYNPPRPNPSTTTEEWIRVHLLPPRPLRLRHHRHPVTYPTPTTATTKHESRQPKPCPN